MDCPICSKEMQPMKKLDHWRCVSCKKSVQQLNIFETNNEGHEGKKKRRGGNETKPF